MALICVRGPSPEFSRRRFQADRHCRMHGCTSRWPIVAEHDLQSTCSKVRLHMRVHRPVSSQSAAPHSGLLKRSNDVPSGCSVVGGHLKNINVQQIKHSTQAQRGGRLPNQGETVRCLISTD